MTKAARWIPEDVAALEHLKFNGCPLSFGWLSNDFGDAGVIGDATGANAEHGADLVERGIRSGVAALHEIAGFRGGAACATRRGAPAPPPPGTSPTLRRPTRGSWWPHGGPPTTTRCAPR
ncbi:hypothetical protein ACOI9R_36565, partial [Mesorhizobium japonicum]